MAKTTAHILVVDDDADVLQSARTILRQHFTTVKTEADPRRIPFLMQQDPYDAVLLDMNFTTGVTKGSEGLFWLKSILEEKSSVSVIMITAYADVKLAVEAMKTGALDFVVKPWENEKLIATVAAGVKLAQSKQEIANLRLRQTRITEVYAAPDDFIIGHSKAMMQVQSMIKKVAGTDANILIRGENGTGKELAAKAIHQQSQRSNGPFVKVDVGAIAPTLFESEFFGHKKGAFTDAREDRMGRFELASNGTLFLDEIGNLSLQLQAKLLTVLQNREVTPVGSNNAVAVNIRLISATNSSIEELIADYRFREDLLYRINTVELHLPPLRERFDDLPLLLDLFVTRYAYKYSKAIKIEDDIIAHLKQHNWPGNIRELQHAAERAVILCDSDRLTKKDFPLPEKGTGFKNHDLSLDAVEKQTISQVIHKNNGNLSQAAKELGLGRTTLYRKIRKYGLQLPDLNTDDLA